MDRDRVVKHLDKCLQEIFDRIPKGKKPFPIQEASFVESLARCGVDVYLARMTESQFQAAGEDGANPNGG